MSTNSSSSIKFDAKVAVITAAAQGMNQTHLYVIVKLVDIYCNFCT